MSEIKPDNIYWFDAIRNVTGKGWRRTKTGYETFISYHCHSISLGTYKRLEDAEEAVFNYRVRRLVSGVERYGLNIDDSVVFMNRYLAFPNGMIFNIHGEIMHGCVNRHGYVHSIFNGRNIEFHIIIASLFCEREYGKNFVNHVDGDKQNNDYTNLEWSTRSENTLHSYRIGLQTTVGGSPVYTDSEKRYMKEHCYDYYRDVANDLGRNPETVRKYLAKYRKELQNGRI